MKRKDKEHTETILIQQKEKSYEMCCEKRNIKNTATDEHTHTKITSTDNTNTVQYTFILYNIFQPMLI